MLPISDKCKKVHKKLIESKKICKHKESFKQTKSEINKNNKEWFNQSANNASAICRQNYAFNRILFYFFENTSNISN